MYLVTYEPETGIITSAGVIDSAYALQPEELPEGSVYTEALPKGDLTGWLYQDDGFVLRPVTIATLLADGEETTAPVYTV